MSNLQIPLANAPYAGQPGSAYSAVTASPSIANTAYFTFPVGLIIIFGKTNWLLALQTGSGTYTAFGTTTYPANGVALMFWSDGSNLAIQNGTGGADTINYIVVR